MHTPPPPPQPTARTTRPGRRGDKLAQRKECAYLVLALASKRFLLKLRRLLVGVVPRQKVREFLASSGLGGHELAVRTFLLHDLAVVLRLREDKTASQSLSQSSGGKGISLA
jgi:hypothetical protein